MGRAQRQGAAVAAPGRMETRRQRADRLSGQLMAVPGVNAVLLFGSVARGDDHERSDLDLLVLADTSIAVPSLLARYLPSAQMIDVGLLIHTEDSLRSLVTLDPAFLRHLALHAQQLGGDTQQLANLHVLAQQPVPWAEVKDRIVRENKQALVALDHDKNMPAAEGLRSARVLADRAIMALRPLIGGGEARAGVREELQLQQPQLQGPLQTIQDAKNDGPVTFEQAYDAVMSVLDGLAQLPPTEKQSL